MDGDVFCVSQKTIRNTIACKGIGLHTGKLVNMTVRPAAPNSGIVFRRTDLASTDRTITDIPAKYDYMLDTTLCSLLGNAFGTRVGTIEHLMAALAGLEISNIIVEVDTEELPIMDGSSAPFVMLLECAGIVDQAAPRRVLRVLKEVTVVEDNRKIALVPDEVSSIFYGIDFETPVIARQNYAFFLFPDAFKREISRARTFGFAHQVDMLRARGLTRGGSLNNAVVIQDDKILNDGGLRFSDEFVRHKVLDAFGDLYLAGGPILGRLEAQACGHRLHNAILQALFSDEMAYEWVTGPWGGTMKFDDVDLDVVPQAAQ
jgi:UDP-3-O-[3-hydroxymyristoyl] N-acetylglucosamine deacetylase